MGRVYVEANLRILEIEEIKNLPYQPLSHPFVERLIGTARQELLDQTFFWNATDLQKKLTGFQHYYNKHRTHTGTDATPKYLKNLVKYQTVLRLICAISNGCHFVTGCFTCLKLLETAIRHPQVPATLTLRQFIHELAVLSKWRDDLPYSC